MEPHGTSFEKKPHKKHSLFITLIAVCVLVVGLGLFLFYQESSFFHNLAIFDSEGVISLHERSLMIIVTLLMLVVVVPVFAFTFFIVWRYRASKETNKPSRYNPEWNHSEVIESIWWGIPCVIILVLSVIVWQSSHDLDPYKPLDSNVKPITIQVIALDWKWLFIYPEQGIATVNFVEFPAETPINFQVTSDAPMNSFWIPQLAGQIYAMPGMLTQLHLEAFKPGTYDGLSANISGSGFADMKFIARSAATADFNSWVTHVREGTSTLTHAGYDKLAQPSQNNPVALYASVDKNLYNDSIMKYMMPASTTTQVQDASGIDGMDMEGMDMSN